MTKRGNPRGKKGGPKGPGQKRGGHKGGGKRSVQSDPRGKFGQKQGKAGGGPRGGQQGGGTFGGSRDGGGGRRHRGRSERASRTFLGKVDKNKSGFAFIIPTEGDGQDVYVDRDQASRLMEGDIVEFSVTRMGAKPAAQIERIVEHGQKSAIGQVMRYQGETWLRASEHEQFLLVDQPGLKEGMWVICDIIEYPRGTKPPVVKVTEILGDGLLPEHDLPIAITKFGLPSVFSTAALSAAEGLRAESVAEATAEGRKDLREMPFVTIDGITAKDFDDAVYVKKTPEGGFVLYVAIADVAFFVRPGNPIDIDAVARSTSVYFPGVCIPMLPESLSNDLCSLRPREDKLTVTAEIHFSNHGKVGVTRFYDSVIKTVRRLTYEEVEDFFEGKGITDNLEGPMKDARELFEILLMLRRERGALDFELTECDIQVDQKGKPTNCQPAKRLTSHKLIEEFMIAANSAVAKELTRRGAAALHRVHEPPEPDSLYEIRELLERLGIKHNIQDLNPKTLSKLLAATSDHPSKKTLHQSILRSMKQARYDQTPTGHFGLALKDYAHFTSPIRRYPDLVVHRALKSLMHRATNADTTVNPSVSDLGPETSQKERRAMEAERFVVKRKQCWFMKDKVGKDFEAVVTGVTPKGIFLEIPKYCIEGYLPGDALKGMFEYDEAHMCLRRRPGHYTIGLGTEMKVQLARVSVEDGEITFTQQAL